MRPSEVKKSLRRMASRSRSTSECCNPCCLWSSNEEAKKRSDEEVQSVAPAAGAGGACVACGAAAATADVASVLAPSAVWSTAVFPAVSPAASPAVSPVSL
eukprot:CAMPEP_0197592320 /NCGR_PEP_ID=MMETSP1326-20131121/15029_1 /TAXON_ID=1155430 /ORGANISM="Genus nov. species nov., Strain RCC2288" /LENGTH=100 /DNA_ID=CAMNT_0043158007 /DNA_START=164 /DNA_END=463 /DNA_ORIENTATION=-